MEYLLQFSNKDINGSVEDALTFLLVACIVIGLPLAYRQSKKERQKARAKKSGTTTKVSKASRLQKAG